MTKYTPERLQEMAKEVLEDVGTMEYVALINIVGGFTGLPINEVVRRIENLAKCGKEECE